MTKAKAQSEYYKDTAIPNALLDELMQQLPALPTQEDLFGPEGVVKRLSAALIERCLQAELSTHLGYEQNQRAEQTRANHRNGYTRPYNPQRPQVCMDEVNTPLLETRDPLPMEPGKPKREDHEYERRGVCNVFLACEPLAGQRFTMVTTQRTKQEWAEFIRRLSNECYPDAEKIVLVMDNLNTHTLASLYEVFPVAQARRLCQRFEVHYTPKHAN